MGGKFSIDGELVKSLAKILVETDLTELEIEDDGCRIYVSRKQNITTNVVSAPVSSHISAPNVMNTPIELSTTANPAVASHAGAVRSPMVGTAYLSPEPGAPTFVKVGDQVQEGQTLLIVEAMKVMNPIKAPKAGKITQVLVKDTSPVEFDEPLVVIE